jgi:hypothetical protein
VNLELDIASNYPPFDRDAFKAMTDSERREYENNVMTVVSRQSRVGSRKSSVISLSRQSQSSVDDAGD